jgi:hypothetical protein
MAGINRLPPRLSPDLYKSFELIRPATTHYRTARCEEVECEAHRAGWFTRLDVSTNLGVQQAKYIYNRSGRSFSYVLDGDIATFTFPAGQQCFQHHQVPLEREPLYVVRRGWTREPWEPLRDHRRHSRGDLWVEEFQESVQPIRDAQERG